LCGTPFGVYSIFGSSDLALSVRILTMTFRLFPSCEGTDLSTSCLDGGMSALDGKSLSCPPGKACLAHPAF
jgi:hypothetical protein